MANSLRVIFGIFGVILFLTEIVPAAAHFESTAQREAKYKKAVEADPENAEAHYNLGSLTSSIDELNRAIELKPDYWPAYLARGHAYERDGQLDKAIQDFTIVITQRPNEPAAYLARADAYDKDGQLGKAIQDFTIVIAQRPNEPAAYIGRARVYAKRPFSSLWAIWDVDKAIEIDKDNFRASDLRAEIKKKSWLPSQAWYLLGIKDPIEKTITGEQRIKEFEKESKAFEEMVKNGSRSPELKLRPFLGMKEATAPVEEMTIDQRRKALEELSVFPEQKPSPVVGMRMKEAAPPVEEIWTTDQMSKALEEINKASREMKPSRLGVDLLDQSEFDKLNVDRSRK
jgi:Tfp pilus assembly protein PilF